MNDKEKENEIFEAVQEYLKPCRVIVWGSGATIPFGFPSMNDLKEGLGLKGREDLESALSKITDEKTRKCYEQKIFELINEKDKEFRESVNDKTFQDLECFIRYFYKASPHLVDIITTNYDCVLEYFLSYYSFPFSDGFSGREFSFFNKENFKRDNHINLFKVHGSLRWSNRRYSHHNNSMDAIYPYGDKYEKTYENPFRILISKSEDSVEKSSNFLVIGFGFNDNHIRNLLETSVEKSIVKMVVVNRKATENTKRIMEKAQNIILIEEAEDACSTKFTHKKNGKEEKCFCLEGKFWDLHEFKSILL